MKRNAVSVLSPRMRSSLSLKGPYVMAKETRVGRVCPLLGWLLNAMNLPRDLSCYGDMP